MQVIRVLGKLEPGGAQLSLLRISRELERRHGVRTGLVAGDAKARWHQTPSTEIPNSCALNFWNSGSNSW
jgi:hypothetical protein